VNAGVVIVAGGEATRLPGKLALSSGALPLLARVFANVRGDGEIAVACKGSFPAELDAMLEAPLIVDRWTRRGPLAGMLTAMARMRSRYVFAVAGDAPFVDGRILERLSAAWREGDEAVVPSHVHEGAVRREPLAALYDRVAFLREGFPLLRGGNGALVSVIDRLQTRFVPFPDGSAFANINTPADYAALSTEQS
jgi:molybdopterin-guanine dinucleotide biosynthesis protein A